MSRMGFFEDAGDRDRARGRTANGPRRPRGPQDELPVALTLAEVVAVGTDVAVVVSGIEVCSSGFTFTVRAVRHPEAPGHDADLHADMAGTPESSSATRLRIGVRYADGRVAVSGGVPYADAGQDRDVVLQSLGGSGTADGMEQRYRAVPIPTEGDVDLIVAWPAREIPKTTLRLPGDDVRSAARAVRPIWPESTGRD